MVTFLGMEVEQPGKVIKLHLDSYIQEVLPEYKEYIKKALRLKRVLMSPGLVLDNGDCPVQKLLASFNNHEEAYNMLCGKGRVRTQDL